MTQPEPGRGERGDGRQQEQPLVALAVAPEGDCRRNQCPEQEHLDENVDELAEHAMEDIDTTFAPNVQPGDYVVAGKNFGCGSSREHAPVVIKVKGVKCIIADSFARIFYRNAINIGLPVLEIGKDVEKIAAGDELDVNMAAGEIKIVNKGITIQTKPLPEFIQKIADCGGLINYVKGEHQE